MTRTGITDTEGDPREGPSITSQPWREKKGRWEGERRKERENNVFPTQMSSV